MASAEMIVVPPPSAPEVARDFVVRCILHGVEVYFEPGDKLPHAVPAGLSDVKGIVIEDELYAANEKIIEGYKAAGAYVYRMRRENSPAVPNATLAWAGELTFHAICFDAGAAYRNPRFARTLQSRDEMELIRSLAERLLANDKTSWYDATRYQWEAMFDVHEVLGDERFLQLATKQIYHSIDHVPNPLSNCDTVAPLAPVVRLFNRNNDPKLLDYARRTFDRYLEITPRNRGCLVNFGVYANCVRAEIQFQVLPPLMMLARATGESRYMEFAMEEYGRLHELLFDGKLGLWHHGIGRGGHSGAFWGRGVAFTLLGDSLMLELGDPGHPSYALCRAAFQQGAETLAKYQDRQSGFWKCVIDEPVSQDESSGAGWIVAAMESGMRLGHLPARYREVTDRGWDAIKTRIWQGDFPGHMTATTVATPRDYYAKKFLNDTGWPHFALRAACERLRGRA